MRIRSREKVAFLLSMIMLCGCKPHATLRVPSKMAPLQLRCQAYSELRPRKIKQTHYYTSNGGESVEDQLTLANDTKVYHLEDLRAVIDPGSPTALSLDSAASNYTKATWFGVGGGASLILWLALEANAPIDSGLFDPPASVAFVSTVVLAMFSYRYYSKSTGARWNAMEGFDSSLRGRLALQEEDIQGHCVEQESEP